MLKKDGHAQTTRQIMAIEQKRNSFGVPGCTAYNIYVIIGMD